MSRDGVPVREGPRYPDCGCLTTDHPPDAQCKGLLVRCTERYAEGCPQVLSATALIGHALPVDPAGAYLRHLTAGAGLNKEQFSAEYMARAEGAPAELRPPPEHADRELHWIQAEGDDPDIGAWDTSSPVAAWRIFDTTAGLTSGAEMARLGYRYLGPAEFDASAWDREQQLRKASDDMLQAAAKRIAELEAVQSYEPTGADVKSLATALKAGYLDCTFREALVPHFDDGKWLRAARAAFDHPGYLPSIAKARMDHVARIRELEAENAALRTGSVGKLLRQAQELQAEVAQWKRVAVDQRLFASDPRGVTQLDSAEFEHLVIPIGTLTGEQKVEADRQLARSMRQIRTAVATGPRRGEFVTCEAGHLVCEVTGFEADARPALGEWRVDHRYKDGVCPCGSEYWRGSLRRFHIKGRGWV